jgi:hypothetical protein
MVITAHAEKGETQQSKTGQLLHQLIDSTTIQQTAAGSTSLACDEFCPAAVV